MERKPPRTIPRYVIDQECVQVIVCSSDFSVIRIYLFRHLYATFPPPKMLSAQLPLASKHSFQCLPHSCRRQVVVFCEVEEP